MRKGTVVAIVSIIVTLTGCGGESHKEKRGRGDAPVSEFRNDLPADVINMPDNFGNVARKCFEEDMVYVTSRSDHRAGHGVYVITNHPRCGK